MGKHAALPVAEAAPPLPKIKLYVAILLFAAAAAFGQQESDDIGEFSVMTGAAFGPIGTHPSLSGSAGISLSHFAMVSVDSGIIPVGRVTLLPAGSVPVKGSDLFSFGIALQGRIPVNRWEPYMLLEPSLLVNSYQAGELTESGSVNWRGNRHSKFGLQGGAGVRYYINSKWGVRAEYRYISSTKNFNEIKAGVFYQVEGYSGFNFRKDWNRRIKHRSDPDQHNPLLQLSTR